MRDNEINIRDWVTIASRQTDAVSFQVFVARGKRKGATAKKEEEEETKNEKNKRKNKKKRQQRQQEDAAIFYRETPGLDLPTVPPRESWTHEMDSYGEILWALLHSSVLAPAFRNGWGNAQGFEDGNTIFLELSSGFCFLKLHRWNLVFEALFRELCLWDVVIEWFWVYLSFGIHIISL